MSYSEEPSISSSSYSNHQCSNTSGVNLGENEPRKIEIDQNLLIDYTHISILSKIAEGSHSTVYHGRYKDMDVAVKMIQKDVKASSERSDRFVREVTMLSRVEHDNLVKFIGAAVEPEMIIVTEIMRGGSLQSYLRNMRPRRPELRQSISFALDISRGMECLHSNGIIHRDLKPANLLLTEDYMKLKLADFGMAREKTAGEMMTCEAGTYKWMAPELYSIEPLERGKKKHYDQKVDVYSFSIVFWQLLTNCTPYKGMSSMQAAFAVASKNLRPNVEKLPKEFVSLIESCWDVDPKTRPEFTEISIILSHYLNSITSALHLVPPEQALEHKSQDKTNKQQAQQLQRVSSPVEPDSPDTHQLIKEQMGEKVIFKKLLSIRKKHSSAGSDSCFGKCSLG
ncbi:hypothetical protein MKW98_025451 [Papaver atlanticum]|uniref:Protein kinase domain-containing protein n=1 Tax=Papaver atlanticum TaxID=357466 RepID=A0AAD4SE85_9MAGN|nr:hypothetical protein MKW98_025451 [Papaver atlanticum]